MLYDGRLCAVVERLALGRDHAFDHLRLAQRNSLLKCSAMTKQCLLHNCSAVTSSVVIIARNYSVDTFTAMRMNRVWGVGCRVNLVVAGENELRAVVEELEHVLLD